MKKCNIAFICGAHDYHAMDWYRAAIKYFKKKGSEPTLLTDSITGEGFPSLVQDNDNIYKLYIIDNILFRKQSAIGHIWRNLVKILCLPIQVLLVRRYDSKNKIQIYYAHSMYYAAIAYFAQITYVATPQGSEILVRPYKSRFYRWLSKIVLKSAKMITVDSVAMQKQCYELYGCKPNIIQNGIDINDILLNCKRNENHDKDYRILSLRGMAELYQIDKIIWTRNNTCTTPIDFIFPFADDEYLKKIKGIISVDDKIIGRVTKPNIYNIFSRCLLAVSIPRSDSSPRSVYEAIFSGAVIATTNNGYIQSLPLSMRKRIIVVDLENPSWLVDALKFAVSNAHIPFAPCQESLARFDQFYSFKLMHEQLIETLSK